VTADRKPQKLRLGATPAALAGDVQRHRRQGSEGRSAADDTNAKLEALRKEMNEEREKLKAEMNEEREKLKAEMEKREKELKEENEKREKREKELKEENEKREKREKELEEKLAAAIAERKDDFDSGVHARGCVPA
jgi:chromosome segregation ATPase